MVTLELYKHEHLHSTKKFVAYERFSNGAIELHKDYVVFYRNLLFNFKSAVRGRVSTIINFDDIIAITYKGAGWFPGLYKIYMRNVQRPFIFIMTNWFPWTNKELNLKLRPIYQTLCEKVQIAWKKDKLSIIQSFDNIRKMGNCPICGDTISADSAFCNRCGTKLIEN